LRSICEQTGKKWEEVESLLECVRAEHEQEITRRQSPLLSMIALVTFIAGVGISIYSAYFLVMVIQGYCNMPVSPLGIPDLFQAIFTTAYTSIGGLVLGLGMMLGSILGMRQVWAAILKIY
jgi:hypothetical protein